MKKLIIAISILLSGCDYYDSSLKIANNSKIEIAVEESNRRDSIFFNNIEFYLSNIIEPDSTISLSRRGMPLISAWHKYVAESPQKKMFIYVFAVDTLKRYQGKKTMYALSEKQLDDVHWKVQFR